MSFSLLNLRRLAVLAIVLAGLSATPAFSGDAAARRILGFSPDGNVFAFEQYSTLYDSTEHIVEIQVIDTRTDSFIKGSPFRMRTDEDSKGGRDLGEARNELMRKARPLIGPLKIGEPGKHFAGKPSMELDDIGIYQMAENPLAKTQDIELPGGQKVRLAIAEQALGKASCYGAGGRSTFGDIIAQGLTLTLAIDGSEPIALQADKRLPKSRRCITEYGIAEAWLHAAPDGAQTLAVLIETVDAHEFHAGPNRRFMAVTKRLPTMR